MYETVLGAFIGYAFLAILLGTSISNVLSCIFGVGIAAFIVRRLPWKS